MPRALLLALILTPTLHPLCPVPQAPARSLSSPKTSRIRRHQPRPLDPGTSPATPSSPSSPDKTAHGKYARASLVRCPAPAQRTHAFHSSRATCPSRSATTTSAEPTSTSRPLSPTATPSSSTAGGAKSASPTPASSQRLPPPTPTSKPPSPTRSTAPKTGTPAPPVPLGRWFLLEWEFNDQPDQETLWVDGQQIMDSPFTYKSTTQSTTGLIGAFTDLSRPASSCAACCPCPLRHLLRRHSPRRPPPRSGEVSHPLPRRHSDSKSQNLRIGSCSSDLRGGFNPTDKSTSKSKGSFSPRPSLQSGTKPDPQLVRILTHLERMFWGETTRAYPAIDFSYRLH